MDELGLSWLPPLQRLSLRPAVNRIVGSLQAIESRSKRLGGVAIIYAWMLPLEQRPWELFGVQEASELADFRRLLTKSASVLRLRSHEVALQWTLRDGAVRACVLMQNLERPIFEEVRTAFVVLWPGLPLFAVQTPRERHVRREVFMALNKALNGVPVRRLRAPRHDLAAAFRSVLAPLGLPVGDDTAGAPAKAVAPSDEAVLDMLPLDVNDAKTKQRLADWDEALSELGSHLQPVEHIYKISDKFGTISVRFEGPDLVEKLRRLYARGFDNIISPTMMPAFLGKDSHVVDNPL